MCCFRPRGRYLLLILTVLYPPLLEFLKFSAADWNIHSVRAET
jgi:hypothetical protein